MRVFISWSKERSRQLALALQRWLPHVMQNVKPWMSTDDIDKGFNWSTVIGSTLEKTDIGILCVTRENKDNPWLLFEAGALSKKGESRVIPYLLDMKPEELRGSPLAQFNAAKNDKEDTLRVLRSINVALGEFGLSDSLLVESHDRWWRDLDEAMKRIPQSEAPPPEPPSEKESLATMQRQLNSLFQLVEERMPRREKQNVLAKAKERKNEVDGSVKEVLRELDLLEKDAFTARENGDHALAETIFGQRNRLREKYENLIKAYFDSLRVS